MRRLTMLTLAATLAVTACSSDQQASTTSTTVQAEPGSTTPEVTVADDATADLPAATNAATTTPAADTISVPDPESSAAADSVTEDDLTLFIAAAERALEGTSQQAAIFDDPEIYIALAQTSCTRFSTGASFEQIATDLLADLDTDDAQDETRLVGAILGAATQTLCPEHADKI